MKHSEASKIKCDTCGATVGLYQHPGGWRCPKCIWEERDQLLAAAQEILIKAVGLTASEHLIKSKFILRLEQAVIRCENRS